MFKYLIKTDCQISQNALMRVDYTCGIKQVELHSIIYSVYKTSSIGQMYMTCKSELKLREI